MLSLGGPTFKKKKKTQSMTKINLSICYLLPTIPPTISFELQLSKNASSIGPKIQHRLHKTGLKPVSSTAQGKGGRFAVYFDQHMGASHTVPMLFVGGDRIFGIYTSFPIKITSTTFSYGEFGDMYECRNKSNNAILCLMRPVVDACKNRKR